MARPRKAKLPYTPTPQEAARFGIDTLSFTIPKVLNLTTDEIGSPAYEKSRFDDSKFIEDFLQAYISPYLRLSDFKHLPGDGFYCRNISYNQTVEDPREHISADCEPIPEDYKGKSAEFIRISYCPRASTPGKLYENKTTRIHLHGELLKRIDYIPLLRWIIEQGGKITRLDLYKDDFDRLLNMETIYGISQTSSWQQHVKSRLVHQYSDIYPGENSVYYGSKSNYIQLHIYNKALERQEKFHHIRVELKLTKKDLSQTGIVAQIVNDQAQECQIISSLIATYLNFLPKDATNQFWRHRTKPFQWWSDFLGATVPVKIKSLLPPRVAVPLSPEQNEKQQMKLKKMIATLQDKLIELEFANLF